jgi:hypothetical protein
LPEVRLTFAGVPEPAVAAAESVAAAQDQVAAAATAANEKIAASAETSARTVAEAAASNIAKAAAQREELAQLAAQYVETARTVQAGSAEQAAALDLAAAAYRRLGGSAEAAATVQINALRGVTAETEAAATAQVVAARRTAEAREARGVASGLGVFGGRAAAFGSTAFLGGALAGVEIHDALKAVREFQTSQVQLVGALKNVGDASAASRREVTETVESLEQLGFKGTDARESLTRLVIATKSAGEADADLQRAANIARARHIELSSATQILSRIEAGRATGLSRFGIQVTNVTKYEDELRNAHIKVNDANRAAVTELSRRAAAMDKTATRQQALAEVDRRFGGAAERNARTAAGASERLAASWERLQVAVGRGVLPEMTKLSNAVADQIDKMTKSGALQRDVAAAAHGVSTAFHDAGEAIRLVDKVSGSLANTLKVVAAYWVTGKVVAFAVSIGTTLVRAFQALRISLLGLAAAEDVAFPWMAIAQAAVAASILIYENWDKVRGFFVGLGKAISAAFDIAWDYIKEQAVNTALAVVEPFSHLPAFLGGWARKAKETLQTEYGAINDDMHKQIGAMTSAWSDGGDAAGRAFSVAAEAWIQRTAHDAATVVAASGETAAAAAAASPRRAGAGVPQGSAGTSSGSVSVAPGANRAGVPIKSHVIAFVRDLSAFVGQPLTIGTGSNHNEYVLGTTHQSDHWTGDAADIPASGAFLTHLGQSALIVAGADPAWAVKQTGGAYNVGGVNILFNTTIGGNHFNHLHVGLHSWSGTRDSGHTRQTVAPATPKPPATDPFAAAIASAAATGAAGTRARGTSASTLETLRGAVAAEVKRIVDAPGPLDDAERSAIARMKRIVAALTPKTTPTELAAARVELRKIETAVNAHISQVEKAAKAEEEAAKKFKASVKPIQDALAGILAPAGTLSLSDLASSIGSQRSALVAAGGSVDSVAAAAEARLRKLGDQLATLKPSQGTLRDRIKAQIQTWGEALLNELNAQVGRAEARQQLYAATVDRYWRDQTTTIQRAFDAVTRRQEDAMSAETAAWEKNFDSETSSWLDAFDRDTTAALAGMQTAAEQQVNDLQILVHSAVGDFLFGGAIGQTPAEAALAALQDQGQTTDLARAVSDAQAALEKANIVGDPTAIRDAQRALDDARLAQQEADLQKRANVEKDAASTQLDIAKQALQRQLDAQQQAYQDQRQIARDQYAAQRSIERDAYDQGRAARLAGYDQDRADQWQRLDDQLGDLKTQLNARLITWAQYVAGVQAILAGAGVSPIDLAPPPTPTGGSGSGASGSGSGNAPPDVIRAPSRFVPGGAVMLQTGGYFTDPLHAIIASHEPEYAVPDSWLDPATRARVRSILAAHKAPGVSAATAMATGSGGPGAAPLAGGRAATMIYVQVDVAGNVTAERDLALGIRDTLVEHGLNTGGNVFGGQA